MGWVAMMNLLLLVLNTAAVVGTTYRSLLPQRKIAFQLRSHGKNNLDIHNRKTGTNQRFVGSASSASSSASPIVRSSAFCRHGIAHHQASITTWSNNAKRFGSRRSHNHVNHSLASASSSWSSINSLNLLRGGGGDSSTTAIDVPSLLENIFTPSSTSVAILMALSKLVTGSALFIGTYALLAPVNFANNIVLKLKGIDLQNDDDGVANVGEMGRVEADSFDSSLIQSIGAILIGFAIHAYLALKKTATPLSHAMGCALLPRILLITWSFLRSRFNIRRRRESNIKYNECISSSDEYQFEGTKFLKINYFVMSWTAFSLLTGAGNPSLSAKVFSIMALVKALALVFKPVEMTDKLFGVDVSGKEMAQSCFLSSTLGYYLAVHAFLMISLACGVNPKFAVGISISALARAVLKVWIPLRSNTD